MAARRVVSGEDARRDCRHNETMHNNQHIPWSDEERDTLRRLRENGLSIRQCSEMLGRPFHGVDRQIRRMDIQKSAQQPPQQPRPEPPRRVGLVSLPPLPSLRHE